MFKSFLFSNYIFSKTPDFVIINENKLEFDNRLVRAEEIELWIQENKNIINIVNIIILDDYDEGMSELFEDNFVQCKKGFFGAPEFEKAVAIINSPLKTKEEKPFHPLNKLNLEIYLKENTKTKTNSEKLIRITNSKRNNYILFFCQKELEFNDACSNIIASYEECKKPSTSLKSI